jgi:DNA-binding NtrC family response regulator
MNPHGRLENPYPRGCDQPGLELPIDLDMAIVHESPVLITGRHGDGAERIARVIHARSRRARRPFVMVDCRYLRGNTEDPMWRRAVADVRDGVLYVANLQTMTTGVQERMSRLLVPGGRGEQRPGFPGRVIASATPTLFANVRVGQFSSTLFYRLNIIHLQAWTVRASCP